MDKSLRKSLDISWKEGIPASLMLGVVDYYIVPLGLFLGASTQQIGLLVAIPQLLGSFSQLFATRSVELTKSRLKFLVLAATLQASLLIPIALLPLAARPGQMVILILLMAAFRVLGNLIATAWGSLVSDYLPPHKRGHYFGWRSQVIGFAATTSVALAGLALFLMKKINPALGFLAIFLGASAARFISVRLLTHMADLPLHHALESEFSFLDFIRRFRQSNFVKFVLYASSITFATFVASPFFSVFILRDLHFDYLSYMGIQMAAVISGLIACPIWGKHADVVGNAKILKITGFLIPLIPLLWLASPLFGNHLVYFLFIEIFAGFAWGGFNLCATNFVYDAVTPAKRVRCLSYFNLINGTALFAGAALGGFLANRLPAVWGYQLFAVFGLSAILRFAAYFFLAPTFKEVRENARKVSRSKLFMSILGIRPLAGLSRGWSFFSPERATSQSSE